MTIRARSNLLIALAVLALAAIGASAPLAGWPRAMSVSASLAASAFFIARIVRMGVTADSEGVVVRNIGSTQRVAWPDVERIAVGKNHNGALYVEVHERTGRRLICRGASAYSQQTLERWRSALVAAAPPGSAASPHGTPDV